MLDADLQDTPLGVPPKIGGWKRRLTLALGRATRHGVSGIIARYSKVGDPPIFANAQFPWIADLENAWQTIRAEGDAVTRRKDSVPSLVQISPDHKGISDRKWKSFFLWGYGFRIDENCARCPQTTAFLERIPGLYSAFFSIMDPGAHLIPHRGVSKAIFTTHLGLRVPSAAERCWMTVDGHRVYWRDGEAFAFDDTYEHEVRNETPEDRVILLLHVKRPVRFPGSLLADFFLWCVRVSPFIQDALKNLEAWNSGQKR